MRNALLAVGLGLVAGVVLFVPFVAISYRRRGTLTFGRSLGWAAALVYFWAIWTYTLLPLPDPAPLQCAGTNVNPAAFLHDLAGVWRQYGSHPVALITNPTTMQLALNVLLFVPLGFFVRTLGGRGVLVSGVAGLAVSGLVETTQLTGVWGLYRCAYRVFDVDDLLTNTAGALLGSLLALAVYRRRHVPVGPAVPRPVTKPRRLLAMSCDWLAFTLVATGVQVLVRAYQWYVRGDRGTLDSPVASQWGLVVALTIWCVLTLVTGRTVGDLAVQVRYVGGRPTITRAVRFVTGIGGYGLLQLVPPVRGIDWLPGALAGAFVVVSIVLTLSTRRGRGLPGLVGRLEVADVRAPVEDAALARS